MGVRKALRDNLIYLKLRLNKISMRNNEQIIAQASIIFVKLEVAVVQTDLRKRHNIVFYTQRLCS